jgi:hypothetical protein
MAAGWLARPSRGCRDLFVPNDPELGKRQLVVIDDAGWQRVKSDRQLRL